MHVRMVQLDLDSNVMKRVVPAAALLPETLDAPGGSVPLFIELHGAGGDREWISDFVPTVEELFANGVLPPAVLVTFSAGATTCYSGDWPRFIAEELPDLVADRLRTRTDRDGVVLAGVSMGGRGALNVAFRYPRRFAGIAALEPGIEPGLARLPDHRRNSWYRSPAVEAANWGSPVDESRWQLDNPANAAIASAAAIRESAIAIYLECGDEDVFNLHDGAEFLHRVLWDHDIRHEYHLVRWGCHVGPSLIARFGEAHAFLAAALSGSRRIRDDQPLTDEEQGLLQWWAAGMPGDRPPPLRFELLAERSVSVHSAGCRPLRRSAEDDPEMRRAYARLPPTR